MESVSSERERSNSSPRRATEAGVGKGPPGSLRAFSPIFPCTSSGAFRSYGSPKPPWNDSFCLSNLSQISITYNPMSLTHPPGLAFRAQLLCPELGQVHRQRDVCGGGGGIPSGQTFSLSDSAGTVVSDGGPREPCPMGPGEPAWTSSPPQPEVSETQASDFPLSAARLIIFSGCLSYSGSRASDVPSGSLSVSPPGCPGALLNLSLRLKKSMSSLRNGPIS